jgi:CspA family cold shock protein
MRGRVKWYNDVKGYGFIQQDNGEDVFVHYSVIDIEGFRALVDDQEVDYEYDEGPKGLQATKVVPV